MNLFAEGMRAGAAQRELPEDVEFETLPAGEQRAIALRIVRREMGIMTIACAADRRVRGARRAGQRQMF